jgi:hypothetical protein
MFLPLLFSGGVWSKAEHETSFETSGELGSIVGGSVFP